MKQLPCFDDLKALARSNPAAFEHLRQHLCQAYIDSVPVAHRPRLHALQWRIDHEVRQARTALAAVIRISAMMEDSVYRLATALQSLPPPPDPDSATPRRDNVVAFTARQVAGKPHRGTTPPLRDEDN